MEAADNAGDTPLHAAAVYCEVEAVRFLIQARPMHHFVKHPVPSFENLIIIIVIVIIIIVIIVIIIVIIVINIIVVTHALVQAGVNKTAVNKNGKTPADISACAYEQEVELLLQVCG